MMYQTIQTLLFTLLKFKLLTLALPDEGGGAPPVPPPGNLNPPIPDISQVLLLISEKNK